VEGIFIKKGNGVPFSFYWRKGLRFRNPFKIYLYAKAKYGLRRMLLRFIYLGKSSNFYSAFGDTSNVL